MKELDKYFPPTGKCALCGHKDSRHRLWDAIIGNYDAGDTIEEIALNYTLAVSAVKLVVELRPCKNV
jgi:hypothetical protein